MAVLTLDIGSTALKAVVFDHGGRTLAEASAKAPKGPQPAVKEQLSLWQATAALIRRLTLPEEPVDAVIVTGQGDGLWRITSDDRPVLAYQWNSVAGGAAIAKWQADGTLDDHYARTGTVLWAGSAAALWPLLDDAEVARTRAIVKAKDWINYRLTGVIATDLADATIPFLELPSRTIDDGVFERLGMPEAAGLVPEPQAPGALLGPVTDEAAALTGLAAGTPVYLGTLDCATTVLGAGISEPGATVLVLGTTNAVLLLTDNHVPDAEPSGASLAWFQPGRYLRVLGTSSGGAVLDWFLQTHGYHGPQRYQKFWTEAAGSSGRSELALPYLYGERVPFVAPEATAAFTGLTASSTRGDLGRAFSESLAFALRDCWESALTGDGEIVITGGGAQDLHWAELIADVFDRAVTVDPDPLIGCRGLASLVPGYRSVNHAAVSGSADDQRVLVAPGERAAELPARYAKFQEFNTAMKPLWSRT